MFSSLQVRGEQPGGAPDGRGGSGTSWEQSCDPVPLAHGTIGSHPPHKSPECKTPETTVPSPGQRSAPSFQESRAGKGPPPGLPGSRDL